MFSFFIFYNQYLDKPVAYSAVADLSGALLKQKPIIIYGDKATDL